MPLEGKVAQLPDQRTAVINIGSSDGVTTSDVYEIYELGDPVVDPDSGEEIGSIRYTKATVVPKQIMEEMTIVHSSETTTTNPVALGMISTTTKKKKLSNEDRLKSNRNQVEVGDSVVRTNEEELESENEEGSEN